MKTDKEKYLRGEFIFLSSLRGSKSFDPDTLLRVPEATRFSKRVETGLVSTVLPYVTRVTGPDPLYELLFLPKMSRSFYSSGTCRSFDYLRGFYNNMYEKEENENEFGKREGHCDQTQEEKYPGPCTVHEFGTY